MKPALLGALVLLLAAVAVLPARAETVATATDSLVTELMLAAERDDADLAQRLVTDGADPNARDGNGDTALNWAAYYGHFATTRVLLDAGADPRIAGHGNALDIALRRGHEELVQVLSVAMGVRTAPNRQDTMVMVAVLADDADGIVAAIAEDGSPDAHDGVGRPLLHAAARLGHRAALNALLTGGAAVDATDRIGFTALMVAAREAHGDQVELLINAGADVNHTASSRGNGLMPLHLAAIGGDPEIVRMIVEQGAALDARDTDGVVPMLWALAEGKTACVVTLIALGADPTISNNDGDSVAAIAQRQEIQAILDAMR